MAFETNRWTALTPHQTDFYRSQLHATQQLLYSRAAHEAGVVPLAASQFTLQTEQNSEQEAVMWHDPTMMNVDGVCIVVGSHNQHAPSAFIRVGQTAGHFMVEGVTVNSVISGKPGVYGNQLITKYDTDAEEELHVAQVGADFFATSNDEAARLKKPASPLPVPQQVPGSRRHAEILGIPGIVSARLISSLGSLSANLAVNGTTREQTFFTGVPYDLAQALFKTAVHIAATSKEPDSGIVIYNKRGAAGAIFESTAHGITVVRHANVFPNAIAIATAGRPPYNSDIVFVEQHKVYAQFATSEFTTIPAEAYNPQGVINALGNMDAAIPTVTVDAPATLDVDDILRLQHKIMGLLTERSGQPA